MGRVPSSSRRGTALMYSRWSDPAQITSSGSARTAPAAGGRYAAGAEAVYFLHRTSVPLRGAGFFFFLGVPLFGSWLRLARPRGLAALVCCLTHAMPRCRRGSSWCCCCASLLRVRVRSGRRRSNASAGGRCASCLPLLCLRVSAARWRRCAFSCWRSRLRCLWLGCGLVCCGGRRMSCRRWAWLSLALLPAPPPADAAHVAGGVCRGAALGRLLRSAARRMTSLRWVSLLGPRQQTEVPA